MLTVLLTLALPWAVLGAQLEQDPDALVAGDQNGNIDLNLNPGATTTINPAVWVRNQGQAVTFPVEISITNSGDSWLGALSRSNGSVTAYGVENELATSLVVTAPSTGLKCNENNGFTGSVTFTATDPNDRSKLSANSVSQTIVLTVPGGACPAVTPADTTAPTITPNISGTLGSNGWYTSNVSLSWTVSDAQSSISSSSGCGTTNITTDQAATDYTCSATSAGGTNSATVSIKRDATAPYNVAFVGGPAGGSSHYFGSAPAAPTCTADDDTSGLASCNVTGYSSAVGNHTLTATATDNAGRQATATRQYSVLEDTTPPTITPSVTGTLGSNGWYTSNVTVSWTVTEAESTITSSSGCGTTYITADQAATDYTCTATSAGGTNSATVSVKRDAAAPTVNPASVVDSTWRNTSLSETFSASDSGSGLDSSRGILATAGNPFELTASAESTNATTPTVASGTVYDLAGNRSTRSVSAKIDLTDPTISGSVTSGTLNSSTGWYTSAPTVTFSCGDALSGIASCVADGETSNSKTLGELATVQSVSGTATDNAGNDNTDTVSGLKVDLSDPYNIAFVGGPAAGSSHSFGFVPAAPTCTADDDISGLASCVVTGYGSAVGNHTLSATATDHAGRQATATLGYSVLPWRTSGFYSPVDMGGVVNTVKGGSTVPLKFELFAGSTELTETSRIASFKTATMSCATGAVADEIEIVSTGGTSLRYDATGGQFIQNW